MLNNPRYKSMAADFIRSTGLIGQFQALDKDQQQGFSGANGQKTGHGDDEEAHTSTADIYKTQRVRAVRNSSHSRPLGKNPRVPYRTLVIVAPLFAPLISE